MLIAVATSTPANATRTSVSIFLKKLAQLATLELLSIPTPAAQLLNAVTQKQQQLTQKQQKRSAQAGSLPVSSHVLGLKWDLQADTMFQRI